MTIRSISVHYCNNAIVSCNQFQPQVVTLIDIHKEVYSVLKFYGVVLYDVVEIGCMRQ